MCSGVKLYGAHSLMWQSEQHWLKRSYEPFTQPYRQEIIWVLKIIWDHGWMWLRHYDLHWVLFLDRIIINKIHHTIGSPCGCYPQLHMKHLEQKACHGSWSAVHERDGYARGKLPNVPGKQLHYEPMTWWCHDLPFCIIGPLWENPPDTSGFSSQRASNVGALIFSLLLVWSRYWKNSWVAGVLRCHFAHLISLIVQSAQCLLMA